MADVEILKWQEGKNLQWLSRDEIFDAIQRIDNAVFHENGLATKESDIARYEAYRDSYIFAIHEKEIVGYVCWFPITEAFHQDIVRAEHVYDGDISPEDICGLRERKNHLFLLSVAILPAFQKQGISKKFSALLSEELRGIDTADIVSYAFTSGGEHFLNGLGLVAVKDMEDGIKLMNICKSTFDLVLSIPCAVSHKNKKNIKKYVAKHKLLDNVETRFDNLVESLNLDKEDKDEYHKYFARKYKPILKKLRKNPREKDDLLILATAMSSYEGLKDTNRIKNEKKDNAANLLHYAKVFCNQLAEHSDYELMFNDTNSNIKTERTPILFGQVNIYEDCKTEQFEERCAYNFFCVLSELTIDKDKSFKNDAFNIVHFVVPDITYDDLTLLMDQSHEIWCNIYGMDSTSLIPEKYQQPQLEESEQYHTILTDCLASIGYVSLGKIYRIIFSDAEQFGMVRNDNEKLLYLMASEYFTEHERECAHRLALPTTDTQYALCEDGNARQLTLAKTEKFFEDFSMYKSYRAFASLYSYYYVILEKDKKEFHQRILPDECHQDFSSEANILFVLETELFKVTACLAMSRDINEQMKYPDMHEIKAMFRRFISTRPLFEKLHYRYLGAQKEADFIFKQFQIGNILAEYDKSKEVLRNYAEVATAISTSRSSKVLAFIGTVFTFMTVCDKLDNVPGVIASMKKIVCGHPVPTAVFAIIVLMFIGSPISRWGRKFIARRKARD